MPKQISFKLSRVHGIHTEMPVSSSYHSHPTTPSFNKLRVDYKMWSPLSSRSVLPLVLMQGPPPLKAKSKIWWQHYLKHINATLVLLHLTFEPPFPSILFTAQAGGQDQVCPSCLNAQTFRARLAVFITSGQLPVLWFEKKNLYSLCLKWCHQWMLKLSLV